LKRIHLLIDPPYLPNTNKNPLVERKFPIFLSFRNMAPTRTPTRRALLSVNTLSLLSIIEFSLPTEATVSTAQGPDIPGDVEVIIPELQPFAIEQQPMTKGKARVIAKYQITTDSPTLYLVANTVEEVFLRRSPVVVSSKSDSTPRSPSALSYTSECPKEQSVP
jgi:hypothetical protein